jgi:hypothetical protein
MIRAERPLLFFNIDVAINNAVPKAAVPGRSTRILAVRAGCLRRR